MTQVRAALGVWVRAGLQLTPAWSDAAVLTDQAALDEWARKHTGGLIDSMPVSIDEESLLVLAGALVVRTPWRHPFNLWPEGLLTRSSNDFDSVSVLDTPSGPLTRACVEGSGAVDVHLVIGASLAEGIRTLGQKGTLGSQLLAHDGTGPGICMEEYYADDPAPELFLSTREFSIDAGHDLLGDNAVLFGLSTATDRTHGHFPGISPKPLAVSAARQDATATFSAKGFQAAAVTAMEEVGAGVPPHMKRVLMVKFEPPFGFVAVHRPSGLVLTAGWIAT